LIAGAGGATARRFVVGLLVRAEQGFRALGLRDLVALWLLKGPPESTQRRLSSRATEIESRCVGADYSGLKWALKSYDAAFALDFGS
jgi:hypothetical protein